MPLFDGGNEAGAHVVSDGDQAPVVLVSPKRLSTSTTLLMDSGMGTGSDADFQVRAEGATGAKARRAAANCRGHRNGHGRRSPGLRDRASRRR